ncbi:MAG: hypothetical protein ABIY55_27425 [Kofleriaceae bacterium]
MNDLLGRMSLDEKIGEMTPNNATSWASMYDGFQGAALNWFQCARGRLPAVSFPTRPDTAAT